jgi:phospholipid/cholesterol/gamma-HCH transport system substrate-binding protein
MTGSARAPVIKFTAFAIVMVLLTAFLYAIFGQYRMGPVNGYSAIFIDVSRLKEGDTVRVSGVRVGTVNQVSMRPDHKIVVDFDANRDVVLTNETRVAVRYLNLVGDRYLELLDSPGSNNALPVGGQIPLDRTAPALDLDLLLNGLKPVMKGLNPEDVNALTSSLVQILQGEGGNLESLFSKTSSFTAAIGEKSQLVGQLIENLNTVVATVAHDGDKFSGTVNRLEQLVSALSTERDAIGTAIDSLGEGTTSLADLLANARLPLKGTIDQLNRMAPLLDHDKALLDDAIQKAPQNYHKLIRVGSYGSFINFYVCGLRWRVTDLQGRTAVFPWIKQTTGRCGEPDA